MARKKKALETTPLQFLVYCVPGLDVNSCLKSSRESLWTGVVPRSVW